MAAAGVRSEARFARGPDETLVDDLVRAAGGDSIGVLISPDAPTREVRRIVQWASPTKAGPGDILLAVGMSPTPPRLAELLECAAAGGAAAVVVHGFRDEDWVRAAVVRTGIPVLVGSECLSWDELYERLAEAAKRSCPPLVEALFDDGGSAARPDVDGATTTATVIGACTWLPWRSNSVVAAAVCEELTRATAVVEGAVVVVEGGRVFAAVPSSSTLPDPMRIGRQIIRFAADRLQTELVVVVDEPAPPGVRGLAGRRRAVEHALSVLASGRVSCVGRLDDLHPQVLLADLREYFTGRSELLAGSRLERLRQLDERGAEYLATLTAFFDAAGDPNGAAAVLYVHPNTVRYRLRRIQQMTGLDLADPVQRLVVELELRLFPARTTRRGQSADG